MKYLILKNNEGKILRAGNKLLLEAATNGGVITYDGDYQIHTFTSSGYFRTNLENIDVSVLIVGGGGSGYTGYSYNSNKTFNPGGAGGGGEVILTGFSLESSIYEVIVADTTPYNNGGGISSFNGVDALGGLSGGWVASGKSGSGNSSGGSVGSYPDLSSHGGAGGDGGTGGNAYYDGHSHGGIGGEGTYIPGFGTFGGGGGGSAPENGGEGGSGGGGAGGVYGDYSGQDGASNTGGGGGGNYPMTSGIGVSRSVNGGHGGSGIVIIKYKYK